MCGIVGYYGQKKEGQDVSLIRKMLTAIKHRGPDESGAYFNGPIALGSVRLSIIDLSKGTMPISNEDESVWIVYNGVRCSMSIKM